MKKVIAGGGLFSSGLISLTILISTICPGLEVEGPIHWMDLLIEYGLDKMFWILLSITIVGLVLIVLGLVLNCDCSNKKKSTK